MDIFNFLENKQEHKVKATYYVQKQAVPIDLFSSFDKIS